MEQFFALGVLGENMMAEHYYPVDDPKIKCGETVKWHVVIYNHMGSAQYVSIRAKLLNQTTPPPDDMNHTASPVPFFKEIRRVLVDNETWTFPFYWSVEDVAGPNDSFKIKALKLNNTTLTQCLDTAALNGYNFRIVLELWTYSNEAAGFRYGWGAGEEARSAWVQIWFNLTLPTLQQTEEAIVRSQQCLLLTPSIETAKLMDGTLSVGFTMERASADVREGPWWDVDILKSHEGVR